MNNAIFIRVLTHNDKPPMLEQAIAEASRGQVFNTATYIAQPSSFRQIPGSTFAYWVSEQTRQIFKQFAPLGGDGRIIKQGLATADDFRFLRVWWEVSPKHIICGMVKNQFKSYYQLTFSGKKWIPFAKGGAYSQYYSDIHLTVNWEANGKEIKERLNPESGRPYSNIWQLKGTEQSFFFRSGLTWSLRTNGLSFRILPSGCMFGHKGPAIFVQNDDSATLLIILALINSQSFLLLVQTLVARVSLAQSFEVGLIRSIPIPHIPDTFQEQLIQKTHDCIRDKQAMEASNEFSHLFYFPSLLNSKKLSLEESISNHYKTFQAIQGRLATQKAEIDNLVSQLYGINEEDYKILEEFHKSLISNHDLEADDEEDIANSDNIDKQLVASLISYMLGCPLGRWDIRFATGECPLSELPDPFAPLLVCSPGMLVDEDGLPLRETPANYPLSIKWDGILVDDADHPDDVIRHMQEVFTVIWKERAEAIEQEACQILEIKELREYFRRPGKGGFWNDHIQRYSKSRRKAPIYWLLQSSKRNYALWIYYHRLDKDLLFKALVNYVEPKLRLEESRLEQLRAQVKNGGLVGREARQAERDLERKENLLSELRDFRDKLRRAADLGLEPDLNDGVVLNIAPLWELVPWNEAKKYWEELLAGKYEWSSIGKQLRAKGIVR